MELKITVLVGENKKLADAMAQKRAEMTHSLTRDAQEEIDSLQSQLETMKGTINEWIMKYQDLEEKHQAAVSDNFSMRRRSEIQKMSPRHDSVAVKEQLQRAASIRDENILLNRQVLDQQRANQECQNECTGLKHELAKVQQSGGSIRVRELEDQL